MLPVIAIVGRPNVGKSTLFNRLVGERQALVHDQPGVTRDRHYGTATWADRDFVVIDTGGFEPDLTQLDHGDLFRVVRVQAEVAMAEADLILFVVDRKAGLTPADRTTADILRRSMGPADLETKVLMVVNKCDGPMHDLEALEFAELGFDPMELISAEHNRNLYELWDRIESRLPKETFPPTASGDEDDGEIRIAVIGRPNIGKSTLVNQLIGEDRHVVHDSPGTTMDSVDSVIQHKGRQVRLVDTAGVRRRARIDDTLETFATGRAIKTIERCHISLLMIDGTEGVSHQDARLAALIEDRGRAVIILINKWDLVREDPERNVHIIDDELDVSLPHLRWAPRLYIAAKTGKGCHLILPMVERVFAEFEKRISTGPLNRFLESAVAAQSPPQVHNHKVKLNYITQTRVRPPTFVVWGNAPEGVKESYQRYLENRLREEFGFQGSPIRLQVRRKRKPGEAKEEDG